jgi:hypothetical protein
MVLFRTPVQLPILKFYQEQISFVLKITIAITGTVAKEEGL